MLKQTTACCYVVIKQTTACYAWVTCLLAPNPSQSKATTRSNCFTSSSKLSNQKPSPLPRPCASTSVRLLETVVVAMSPSLAVSTQLMQFPPGNSTWRQCSVACLTKREIIAACAERRDALLVGIHNRRSTIVQDLLHSTLVVYLHDVRLYSVTARLYNVAICINNRSGTSLKSKYGRTPGTPDAMVQVTICNVYRRVCTRWTHPLGEWPEFLASCSLLPS